MFAGKSTLRAAERDAARVAGGEPSERAAAMAAYLAKYEGECVCCCVVWRGEGRRASELRHPTHTHPTSPT